MGGWRGGGGQGGAMWRGAVRAKKRGWISGQDTKLTALSFFSSLFFSPFNFKCFLNIFVFNSRVSLKSQNLGFEEIPFDRVPNH